MKGKGRLSASVDADLVAVAQDAVAQGRDLRRGDDGGGALAEAAGVHIELIAI
jgi:hypothetical protein